MSEKDIKSAILESLKEEKTPRSRIVFRGLFWGSLVTAFVTLILYGVSDYLFTESTLALCGSIWIVFVLGLGLVFWPQPRIQPRGYWGPLSYGRLLVGMMLVTLLQLVICPEFASHAFQSEGPLPFLGHITHWYMSMGGMPGCMFLCGLTFTGLGAFVIFRILRQSFESVPYKMLPRLVVLSLVGQLPVMILQVLTPTGRETVLFWLAGSTLALVSMVFIVRRA